MDHWTQSIQALEERAAELETFAKEARTAAQVLRQTQAGGWLTAKTQTKPNGTERKREGEGRNSTPTAGSKPPEKRRGRKNSFSRYKGVYNGGRTADGRQRYMAKICVNGKTKSLGTFYSEKEAAAAVATASQEAANDKEQAENNPDRGASRKGPNEASDGPPEGQVCYVCEHCKLEWQTKPAECPGCHNRTFREKKTGTK